MIVKSEERLPFNTFVKTRMALPEPTQYRIQTDHLFQSGGSEFISNIVTPDGDLIMTRSWESESHAQEFCRLTCNEWPTIEYSVTEMIE
jgi:hypothetical protein